MCHTACTSIVSHFDTCGLGSKLIILKLGFHQDKCHICWGRGLRLCILWEWMDYKLFQGVSKIKFLRWGHINIYISNPYIQNLGIILSAKSIMCKAIFSNKWNNSILYSYSRLRVRVLVLSAQRVYMNNLNNKARYDIF